MTTLPEIDGAHTYIDSPTPPIVVVPIGAFEQHGAHLPFDTDTRIAIAVADSAIERNSQTAAPIMRAPAIQISASDEHLGFPGTMSIGTEGLSRALVALARSASWSVGTIFVNGHGGNADAIALAHEQLTHGSVAHAFWSVSGYPDNDTHAGRSETSMMLHIDPSVVRLDRAQRGNTERLQDLMPTMRLHGVRAVSLNGVLGDPSAASADEGSLLFERNVASLAELIADCDRRWSAAKRRT